MNSIPRETICAPRVAGPLLFRKYLREACALGEKTTTRRVLTEQNSLLTSGLFDNLDLATGRARPNQPQPELRAQCRFGTGRVRVVSVLSTVRAGELFWVKSGRFGSRKASTQTLLVKRVKVARLQDMTEAAAIAEGVRQAPAKFQRPSARETFAALWDDMYEDEFSWAGNPWTWIYEFEAFLLNVDHYVEAVKGGQRV